MDSTCRTQLIKRRAVAEASLPRMQNFIESGDLKVNEIKIRFDELPHIFNKYDTAQDELELYNDTGDRESFEKQYFEVKAKFSELLHPVGEQLLPRYSLSGSSMSGHNNSSARSCHASSAHINLQVTELPTFDGNSSSWLQFRDTFKALIVDNKTLSNVQKFHYLIASLKNEAKDLISNL